MGEIFLTMATAQSLVQGSIDCGILFHFSAEECCYEKHVEEHAVEFVLWLTDQQQNINFQIESCSHEF